MSIGKNTAIVPRGVRVEGDRSKPRDVKSLLGDGVQAWNDAAKEDSRNVAYKRMVAREKEQDKTIYELRLRVATLEAAALEDRVWDASFRPAPVCACSKFILSPGISVKVKDALHAKTACSVNGALASTPA